MVFNSDSTGIIIYNGCLINAERFYWNQNGDTLFFFSWKARATHSFTNNGKNDSTLKIRINMPQYSYYRTFYELELNNNVKKARQEHIQTIMS
jgi:hypothetical protein